MRERYVPRVGDWVRWDFREWRVEEILTSEGQEIDEFVEVFLLGDDGDDTVVSAIHLDYTGVNL